MWVRLCPLFGAHREARAAQGTQSGATTQVAAECKTMESVEIATDLQRSPQRPTS